MKFNISAQNTDFSKLFDSLTLPERKPKAPKMPKLRYAVKFNSGYITSVSASDYMSMVKTEYTEDINKARLFSNVAQIQDTVHKFDLPTDYNVVSVTVQGDQRTVTSNIKNIWHGAAY